jgi:hypothetical protein
MWLEAASGFRKGTRRKAASGFGKGREAGDEALGDMVPSRTPPTGRPRVECHPRLGGARRAAPAMPSSQAVTPHPSSHARLPLPNVCWEWLGWFREFVRRARRCWSLIPSGNGRGVMGGRSALVCRAVRTASERALAVVVFLWERTRLLRHCWCVEILHSVQDDTRGLRHCWCVEILHSVQDDTWGFRMTLGGSG